MDQLIHPQDGPSLEDTRLWTLKALVFEGADPIRAGRNRTQEERAASECKSLGATRPSLDGLASNHSRHCISWTDNGLEGMIRG